MRSDIFSPVQGARTFGAIEQDGVTILHSIAHGMLPDGKIVPLLLDDNGVVFGLSDLHRKVDELTAKVDVMIALLSSDEKLEKYKAIKREIERHFVDGLRRAMPVVEKIRVTQELLLALNRAALSHDSAPPSIFPMVHPLGSIPIVSDLPDGHSPGYVIVYKQEEGGGE